MLSRRAQAKKDIEATVASKAPKVTKYKVPEKEEKPVEEEKPGSGSADDPIIVTTDSDAEWRQVSDSTWDSDW
jgi:hypothetical protein